MDEIKYNLNQDYCDLAKSRQAVPSFDQYHKSHPDIPLKKIDDKRAETLYSCSDNYQMGSIQDNQIYIATTDNQHDQIAKGVHVDAHGGLSGFFSDQATIDACRDKDGVLDNAKYNEMTQIAPYRISGIEGIGDATYKPHIDCFKIDRNALFEKYGTYDFNAAIAKCGANNHFGPGGGNQGYNQYISEMIDDKILKYEPQNSYTDTSINNSKHCNDRKLTNSIVDEDKVEKMYDAAQIRAKDCVNNNTPHPSSEACNNGFLKNENPIQSNTGNAVLFNNDISTGNVAEENTKKFNPDDYIPKTTGVDSSGKGFGTGIE